MYQALVFLLSFIGVALLYILSLLCLSQRIVMLFCSFRLQKIFMHRFLTIIFILVVHLSFGQTKVTSRCKIEIFLLKRNIPSFDTSYKLMGNFTVKNEDLQDTAFIKDDEIISYTIEKYKINNGQRKYKKEYHNKQLLHQ